jgi:DNA-binding PucR family transcriptional regulator
VVELRRHDAAHATRYIETLWVWLLAQSDVSAAADRLEVHPNTVRYRRRKMAESTTLDLDRPEQRLQ